MHSTLLTFLQQKTASHRVLVGLSGGIDSTIVCALAVEALGADKVKGLIVRNSRYPVENLSLVRDFAEKQAIELQEVDTTMIPNTLFGEYGSKAKEETTSSTIDARICDFILRTIASLEDRFYLGTINGTERLTGWYPKGALVGDLCPIGGLLKSQEKKLAQEMGLGHLIETISEDSSRICSGCGELPAFQGIPYEVLDTVLFAYETCPKELLYTSLESKGVRIESVKRILDRVAEVAHKQDVFPPFPQINYTDLRKYSHPVHHL